MAARRLALAGASVIVAVVAADARPRGASAARNWDRIARDSGIVKVHLPVARDVAMFGLGVEKAAVVVDALLGTGVRGALREPIRSAVEVVGRARAAGVPVVAVDTPTAVDLSSGEPSDPAVLADLTVTFHRPKTGLLTRARCRPRRQGPRRPDRDPARGRPWLSRAASAASRAGARSLLVAGAAVAVVLGAAVLTSVLPTGLQEVVFHTPLRDRRPDRRARAGCCGGSRAGRRPDRPRSIEPPAVDAGARTRRPLERRAADLDALARETWDVVIVGGGIVGVGRAARRRLARDAGRARSSRTTSRPGRRRARRG